MINLPIAHYLCGALLGNHCFVEHRLGFENGPFGRFQHGIESAEDVIRNAQMKETILL
jgi:hypothetical protein